MNAAAEEFTPIIHCPGTLNADYGLAEYGQTMKGWQSLAARLESTMSAVAKELEPAMHCSKMAGEQPNFLAINPAFLSDDSAGNAADWRGLSEKVGKIIGASTVPSINPAFLSDDEDNHESMSNDGDKESSDGNPESNESSVDSVDDEDKQSNDGNRSNESNIGILDEIVLGHEGSRSKEEKQEGSDSDKETSFNESVLSWQHDKDMEWSSGVDPGASSVDDLTSVGAPSDSEAEFAVHFPTLPVKLVMAPPGLKLPPWKLPQRRGRFEVTLAAACESKANDLCCTDLPPMDRPWKLAPWKKSM